jgi:multisubunit Na+/H+ antiporter MnhG subunit
MITVYLKLREVLRIMFLAIFETVATHLICSAAMQIKCIATIPKMAKNTIRNTSLNFK